MAGQEGKWHSTSEPEGFIRVCAGGAAADRMRLHGCHQSVGASPLRHDKAVMPM